MFRRWGGRAIEREDRVAVRVIVVLIVVVGLASFGYMFWKALSKVESTDDAQIDGQIHPVSSRVAGHVMAVKVEDEMFVKEGDVLVQLDPRDYEVAVEKAKADLNDAIATLQSMTNRRPHHFDHDGQHLVRSAIFARRRDARREFCRAAIGCIARATHHGAGECQSCRSQFDPRRTGRDPLQNVGR